MILAKWNIANGTDYHCVGYWELYVDGSNYTGHIPVEKRTQPMGTFIDHCEYNKEGHYIHYLSGKDFNQWWTENPWIDQIPTDPCELYNAFRLYDWACGACATCVKKKKEEE